MRVRAKPLLAVLLLLSACAQELEAQDGGGFQLPVQLIGFPVIIMAVRLSNFMKKLAYAVSPRTYRSRTRRSALGGGAGGLSALVEGGATPDPAAVEKLLLGEFGSRVCVYERVCAQYAQRAVDAHGHNHLLDWNTVFSRYKDAPNGEKQNYLLSVFLGDMVRSPSLCMGLAKRGRSCNNMSKTTANHLPEDHHQHLDHQTASTTARPSRRGHQRHSNRQTTATTTQRPPRRVVHRGRAVQNHTVDHTEHNHKPVVHHPRPFHRQPNHPGMNITSVVHSKSNHKVVNHPVSSNPAVDNIAEEQRLADHPAQVARRPHSSRRRPSIHTE